MKQKKTIKRIFSGSRYVLVAVLLVILLFPVFWMVVSSIQPNSYLMSMPPHFIPAEVQWDSYAKILQNTQYMKYFRNSVITSLGTVLLTLVLSIPAGYAFARFHFKGSNALRTAIMSVQMFPIVVILISLYTFYFNWGMLNTYRGLILANTVFCLPLAVSLMTSFFYTVPKELDESAQIDGAGRIRILLQIVTPLTKPGMVAVAIYTFLQSWDDFLMSLIIMQDMNMRTLPVGIAQSFLGEYAHDYSSMMAFAVVGSIPIVLIFLFLQKQMVEGMTAGAVKG